MNWIYENWVEVVGAILAFVYLLLQVKQNWIMWIACLVSAVFYVYIFWTNHLYAMTVLYLYFGVMSLYGIYCWKFAKNKEDKALDFHYISILMWVKILAVSAVIFGVMLFVLWEMPDSPFPVMESLIAALSIVATWMVAQKIIECWYIWIFVDILSVVMYSYQELYPTAILFFCYTVLSVVGLMEWRKKLLEKNV